MRNSLFLFLFLLSISSCKKQDLCLQLLNEPAIIGSSIVLVDCSEKTKTLEIDWGDGEIETVDPDDNQELSHIYKESGSRSIIVTSGRGLSAVSKEIPLQVFEESIRYVGDWAVTEIVEAHDCQGTTVAEETKTYEVTITGNGFGNAIEINNFGDLVVEPIPATLDEATANIKEASSEAISGKDGAQYQVELNCNSSNTPDFINEDTFELDACIVRTLNGETCHYNSILTLVRQ